MSLSKIKYLLVGLVILIVFNAGAALVFDPNVLTNVVEGNVNTNIGHTVYIKTNNSSNITITNNNDNAGVVSGSGSSFGIGTTTIYGGTVLGGNDLTYLKANGVTNGYQNLSDWSGVDILFSSSAGAPRAVTDGTNIWLYSIMGNSSYVQIGTNFNYMSTQSMVLTTNMQPWMYGLAFIGQPWFENGTNYTPFHCESTNYPIGDYPGNVGIATGTTNFTLTASNPVISMNTNISWESRGIYNVSLVHNIYGANSNGFWYIFYNGQDSGFSEQIGFAISTNGVFGPYNRYSANPVLINADSWESTVVGDPAIRWDGEKWEMYYYSISYYGSFPSYAGRAYSYNLTNWVKCANNPIRMNNQANFTRPSPIQIGNKLHLLYEGADGYIQDALPVAGSGYVGGFANGVSGSLNWNANKTLCVGRAGVFNNGGGNYNFLLAGVSPYTPVALTLLDNAAGSATLAMNGTYLYISTEGTRPTLFTHGGGVGQYDTMVDAVIDPVNSRFASYLMFDLRSGATNASGSTIPFYTKPTGDGSGWTNITAGQVGAQPTNANLTTLAGNNGGNLTNLQAGQLTGMINNLLLSTNVLLMTNQVTGSVAFWNNTQWKPSSSLLWSNMTLLILSNGVTVASISTNGNIVALNGSSVGGAGFTNGTASFANSSSVNSNGDGTFRDVTLGIGRFLTLRSGVVLSSPNSGVLRLTSTTGARVNWSQDDTGTTSPAWTAIGAGFVLQRADGAMTSTNSLTVPGIVSATNGFASYASNTVALASITFPASGANWTNTTGRNIHVFIDTSGVTGTTTSINGTQVYSSLVGDMLLPLQPNEWFSMVYTVGTPVAKIKPF